jgi:hypothetical protein
MRSGCIFVLASVWLLALVSACQPALTPTVGPPSLALTSSPPLPTPTASPTPTFNPAASVTRTPLPPAGCPSAHGSAPFTFTRTLDPIEKELLAYLNGGGDPGRIQTAFDVWRAESYPAPGAPDQGGRVLQVDVTGDGVPEILVDVYQKQLETPERFYIFGCKAGAYKTLAALISSYSGQLYDFPLIRDMNLDGVPEIVVGYRSGREPNLYLTVLIFEWNGRDFKNLMAQDDTLVNSEYDVREGDHNGTPDLVITGGQLVGTGGALIPPQRRTVQTWAWNGEKFVRASIAEGFAAPAYRFQAVREGDAASGAGAQGQALAFYVQAITDDNLLGWNPAWLSLETASPKTPTAIPDLTPAPDPDERRRLEMYTRYRIMLLYVVKTYDQEAQIEYTQLQNVAASPSGAPYARLAAAFWENYLVRRDLGLACSRAIEYARAHAPDILAPLGSQFYGSAYPDYTPEEICPFR